MLMEIFSPSPSKVDSVDSKTKDPNTGSYIYKRESTLRFPSYPFSRIITLGEYKDKGDSKAVNKEDL